jgi:PTS system mannose-specific IIB component
LAIANDELAEDELRQQIMLMAVPSRVHTDFLHVHELPAFVTQQRNLKNNALALFANCRDARRAFDLGVAMNCCNVGNLHYSSGKRQLCQHVALSSEDEDCLRYFESRTVKLDFRCIPADEPNLEDW